MTRFAAPIAESIWDMKYRLKEADGTPIDQTVEDTWRRIARALSEGEVGLLADVLGRPGGLPLFQYALTELFDRRVDRMLTLAGYNSMGGVAGALGRRADA